MRPAVRPRLFVSGLLIAAACLGLAAGCGDDETEQVAAPAVPPRIAIRALRSSAGSSFEVDAGPDAPRFIVAGCDPDRTVALEVEITPATFVLRPPGLCGGSSQCGSLVASVEADGKVESTQSAAVSTPLQLAAMPFAPGEHVFRVELRDGANQLITVPGSQATDSVTVEVRASACGAEDGGPDARDGGDAGTDAEPDAPRDAPPDVTPDALDAGNDAVVTDSPLDTASDVADAGPDQG